jgi:hypothetical protein
MVVKWDRFEGFIQGDGCSATMELMFNGPISDPSPYWSVNFLSDGHLEYKPFEAGRLEQAYKWCVETILNHERQHKARGDS